MHRDIYLSHYVRNLYQVAHGAQDKERPCRACVWECVCVCTYMSACVCVCVCMRVHVYSIQKMVHNAHCGKEGPAAHYEGPAAHYNTLQHAAT